MRKYDKNFERLQLENMVSLYLHELSEKEEILDGYEVYTQLFCV